MNLIQQNNITKGVQQLFQYFSTFQLHLLDLTLNEQILSAKKQQKQGSNQWFENFN